MGLLSDIPNKITARFECEAGVKLPKDEHYQGQAKCQPEDNGDNLSDATTILRGSPTGKGKCTESTFRLLGGMGYSAAGAGHFHLRGFGFVEDVASELGQNLV